MRAGYLEKPAYDTGFSMLGFEASSRAGSKSRARVLIMAAMRDEGLRA
jgi:hypothetical protein